MFKAMASMAVRGKPTGKVPKRKKSDKTFMDFDILYQLSYMSVIAAAGVPRNQIFERASQIPCASAEYFRKVELAHQRLQYDYAKACRIVGDSTRDEDMKGLLLRFSNSLLSGEPEADFLSREAEARAESYKNGYGQSVETLKMWTDAYVSLVLSAVLVVIIGIVATMIWKIETSFILGMVAICIGTTAMGIWLIYLMSPREVVILRKAGSREQKQVSRLLTLMLPLALAGSALLAYATGNMGWGLLVAGAAVFPIGHLASKDHQKITKRDVMIGPFLASLGGVSTAIGTTVKEALGRLDLDAIDILMKEVKHLHSRLLSGIRTRLCWTRFVSETGSELVNRSVGMFCDAIEIGGEPKAAGYHASLFSSKIAMLRARRKTVSSPFRWLCIAMHASVVVLLVFITEVITIFGGMIGKAAAEMPKSSGVSMGAFTTFNLTGLQMMHSMVVPLVLIFTVANAVAPSVADGGSKCKVFYNLGITAAISGGALIFLPPMAASLFKTL